MNRGITKINFQCPIETRKKVDWLVSRTRHKNMSRFFRSLVDEKFRKEAPNSLRLKWQTQEEQPEQGELFESPGLIVMPQQARQFDEIYDKLQIKLKGE